MKGKEKAYADYGSPFIRRRSLGRQAAQEIQLAKLLRTLLGLRRAETTARYLLAHFGTLGEVLNAPPHRLQGFDGIGRRSIDTFQTVRTIAEMIALEKVESSSITLGTYGALIDYLRTAMAYEATETFRVLYLSKSNKLLANVILSTGTVDYVPIFPREVIRRALEEQATGMIFVHNHPSGDPSPSSADLTLTRELTEILKPLRMVLHDHIIITQSGHSSLRKLRLL